MAGQAEAVKDSKPRGAEGRGMDGRLDARAWAVIHADFSGVMKHNGFHIL